MLLYVNSNIACCLCFLLCNLLEKMDSTQINPRLLIFIFKIRCWKVHLIVQGVLELLGSHPYNQVIFFKF